MKRLLQIIVAIQIFLGILSKDIFSKEYESACPYPSMFKKYLHETGSEWICDCQSTFLYYSGDDSCYDAYRQGPCPSKHYLIIPPGEIHAKCMKNPCLVDGIVPFQGKCYFLWKSGSPCESNSTYLGVEEDNFELKCVERKYIGFSQSLTTSKSCPNNTIFYSGSTNDTYICECKPGLLYYPQDNSCYKAYRQGPCPSGQYLMLPPEETKAECMQNPCLKDGFVPFRGGCHELDNFGPPCTKEQTKLQVNGKTFELECVYSINGGGLSSGGGIIVAPSKECPKGSRRVSTGLCKHVYQ